MKTPKKTAYCHLEPYSRLDKLFDAACDGDNYTVKRLLKSGKSNINKKDGMGKTALMLAIQASQESTIEILLEFSPDIHLKSPSGKSALEMAFELGLTNKRIVKMFLNALKRECCNDVEALALKLLNAHCPLFLVVLLRDTEILKIMLQKNCVVDARDSHTLKTALHVCVYQRDFANVKLLIDYGADVNAMDAEGNIPFADYQFFDDSDAELDMMRMFVNRKAAWTMPNLEGITQVQWALVQGKKEALRILLKSDIDWCVPDASGFNPFFYLAMNKVLITNPEILDELRDKKITSRAHDSTDISTLKLVSTYNTTKLLEMLLDSGIDPNIPDADRCTPLFTASRCRVRPEKADEQKSTVMLLLQRGADPQGISEDGQTVFDNIIKFQNFHLAEPVLGQLAIGESFGTPITDHIQVTIHSHHFFKDQFLLCKSQLEDLKKIIVRHSVTLFEILSKSAESMAVYGRNQEFWDKLKNFEQFSSNSYYDYVIRKKLQAIMSIMRIRKKTAGLVCDVMGIHCDSYPAIVDKITDYVLL